VDQQGTQRAVMLTYVVEAFAVAFGQTVFELRHLQSQANIPLK